LQKGKFDLDCMLGFMGGGVFSERWKMPHELCCEITVDRDHAQWSSPFAFSHDGQGMSAAGVIWTEDDAASRNFQPRKNCACDLPGIHVSGVRDYAANCAYLFLRRLILRGRKKGINIRAQALRICRIEASSDGGLADDRIHRLASLGRRICRRCEFAKNIGACLQGERLRPH
jgi:hypothetical protein